MKKYITIALALALVLALSVPALAAGETEAKTNLSFTYKVTEPSYTVTIPGYLALSYDNENKLKISVTGVKSLDGKWIEISLIDASVQEGSNLLALSTTIRVPKPYEPYLKYNLISAMGEYSSLPIKEESNLLGVYGEDTDDYYTIKIASDISSIMPVVEYSGYIVFGIRAYSP